MSNEAKCFDSKQAKEMGKRIQNGRKKMELKQIDLAMELNISVDQMSNIENGRVVCKTEYIFLLEQILDVSSDYLLHGECEREDKYNLLMLLEKLTPDQIKRSKLIIENAFL